MTDTPLDANLTAALSAIQAEGAQEAAAGAAPNYEAIVYRVFNEQCTNSPFFQGAQAAVIVTQNFLPALVAALQKG